MRQILGHKLSLQVIVNVDSFEISVIEYTINGIDFLYCILPKMHYCHLLSYRGHWRQG
jgi:hypothetical protein